MSITRMYTRSAHRNHIICNDKHAILRNVSTTESGVVSFLDENIESVDLFTDDEPQFLELPRLNISLSFFRSQQKRFEAVTECLCELRRIHLSLPGVKAAVAAQSSQSVMFFKRP